MISIQNITGQLFLNTLPGLRMHHPQDLCVSLIHNGQLNFFQIPKLTQKYKVLNFLY